MEKTIKIFKYFSEKGYKHYTDNTIEELDEVPLDNHYIITEFAHLCEWLRINHGIWIMVRKVQHPTISYYDYYINGEYLKQPLMGFNTPQEAYSAAFDYILNNNLI